MHRAYLKNKVLWLSVLGIFLGGSAECTMAQSMALAPEQPGMKAGMLVGMLFPLAAIPVRWRICQSYPKEK